MTPNMKDARRHLTALDPNPEARWTFQTFPDNKDGRSEDECKKLTRVLHGTLDKHAVILTWLNKNGAGVFVTVNETDGRGRTKENITAIRSVFADNDKGPFLNLPIEPTLVIESKNGDHAYWSVCSKMTKEDFTVAQKAIAHNLGSDKKVCDPPRVMRLAGFYHMKDPNDPFLVKIKSCSSAKYTAKEIRDAFPPLEPKTERTKGEAQNKTHPIETYEKFMEWAKSLPIDKGTNNPLGGRNCTLLLLIREGLGCGISPELIKKVAHNYCRRAEEKTKVADDMLQRQIQEHNLSPFVSYEVTPKKHFTAADISRRYLLDQNFDDGVCLKFHFYKGEFYRYAGDRYIKISLSDLNANIMSYLQSSCALRVSATINFSNNVIGNIKGSTLVSESVLIPSFLSEPKKQSSRFIPMKNGILDLNRLMAGSKNPLVPHTPDFFSTSCLSFDFDLKAQCPTWKKFLKEVLPNSELRLFLQQWFGYNLVFDTKQHKFVLLVGEGANGKTVVCTVMRALLGNENVSAVGLEQFNPQRTFPIAAMVGKLANIVEEIGEVEKVAEGLLKDFVSGGVMTIERKHKDAFETQATARLTFSTNVMPRFRDRSSGLWRRMIPIPFEIQILDHAKQDKRLVDTDWWIASGELRGIFNWAIHGLMMLNEQGYFTEPKLSRELRDEIKADANPAAIFLSDNYMEKKNGSISCTKLYEEYARWMGIQGSKSLGQGQFSKEVRKSFPNVEQTKNALYQPDGTRSREWRGLIQIDGNISNFSIESR